MKRRDFLAGTATATMMAALGGAWAMGAPKRKPNILWIMFDDGRADALGCYGSPWAKTPHLDRLAAEGVRFETAIVQNPVCVPSRRSMKTGFYPHEVGPMAMGGWKTPQPEPPSYYNYQDMKALGEAPNLLDAFRASGIPPVHVGKIHGYKESWDARGDVPPYINPVGKTTKAAAQLFENPNDVLPDKMVFTKTHRWVIGGISPLKPEQSRPWKLGDMAVENLEPLASGDQPFFFRASFHAPHVACTVPKEYFIDPKTIDLPLPTQEELDGKPAFERGPIRTYAAAELTREEIDLARGTYYGMVALVDQQVGRLLEVLEKHGQLDNTIIAVASDQGFQLGEHGFWKKRAFYEGNVKVPLIIRYPKALPRGKVIDEPVEMIDFLPTLMELQGLTPPADIRGRSLLPLIRGKKKAWREACFSEIDHSLSMYNELRQGTGRRVMVRTKEWKLIFFLDERVADPDGALYDLVNDPGETRNLYNEPKYADRIQQLESLAQRWTAGENLLLK